MRKEKRAEYGNQTEIESGNNSMLYDEQVVKMRTGLPPQPESYPPDRAQRKYSNPSILILLPAQFNHLKFDHADRDEGGRGLRPL
jgi:hypothetical protein